MITGGDLRQSRLDVGYKTFTISPWSQAASSAVAVKDERKNIKSVQAQANQKPVAKSVASDNKGHNELTCSENDRTAGLCN